MTDHPHAEWERPIPYETVQAMIRAGHIERSRAIARLGQDAFRAVRALFGRLIRGARSADPRGDLSGRPA